MSRPDSTSQVHQDTRARPGSIGRHPVLCENPAGARFQKITIYDVVGKPSFLGISTQLTATLEPKRT